MPRTPAADCTYSVHPSVAYAQAIIANLPANTGKSIDDWVRIVKKSGVAAAKDRREWLKKEHKLGGTTASMIVEYTEGSEGARIDGDQYLKAAAEYVEAMYAGPKAALRPIHDALLQLGTSLGKDVKVCPCKTIVPIYRHHVFAEVKPATRTRIDFGLALKGSAKSPAKRLIDTGGLDKGDRITHRIPITSVDEIDAEVKGWLKIAYELDAKE